MLDKQFFLVKEVDEVRKKLEQKKLSIFFKLLFDKVLAILLLFILSPIFVILAFLIKLEDGGDVFYRQERVTTNGKMFRIFKFRTMVINADKIGSLVTVQNDARITKIGSVIRKYRLDELPQLLNIILGEMSFVGARPEVLKYVEQYTDEMKVTLLLPAGVTSLSSIEFKDEDEIIEKYVSEGLTVDEIYISKVLPQKMKANIAYIYQFNLFFDFSIMIKTAIAVLK